MSEKMIVPQARAMRELVRAMRERVLGGGGCKRYSSLQIYKNTHINLRCIYVKQNLEKPTKKNPKSCVNATFFVKCYASHIFVAATAVDVAAFVDKSCSSCRYSDKSCSCKKKSVLHQKSVHACKNAKKKSEKKRGKSWILTIPKSVHTCIRCQGGESLRSGLNCEQDQEEK